MEIPEKITELKALASAAAAVVTGIFGWAVWPVLLWTVLMAVDYLTGTWAAKKAGEWSSTAAREGLWHKGGSIAIVFVSQMADLGMSVMFDHVPALSSLAPEGVTLLMPLVVAWYIVTELGSIAENAVRMGADVPAWLVKCLAKAKQQIDSAGDSAAGDGDAK